MNTLSPNTEAFNKRARELAACIKGNFDYAYGETPVIDLEDRPYVDMQAVTKKQYNAIEAACQKLSATGAGYEVLAIYSDSSGYAYWKREGDVMQVYISAEIKDINAIDVDQLETDMRTMRDDVCDIINEHLGTDNA